MKTTGEIRKLIEARRGPSCWPFSTDGYLIDIIEALFERNKHLERRLEYVYRAAVAHAGDTDAHPSSSNDALRILRDLEEPSVTNARATQLESAAEEKKDG